MDMRQILTILILAMFIASCSSAPAPKEDPNAPPAEVQEGFEDFLKEKEVQDEQAAQAELEKAQERPVTFEPEQKQVKISIPQSLIDDYGQKLIDCYTGTGSEEKIKAQGEYCVTQIAAKNKETRICSQVLESDAADKCYQAIAKEYQDPSFCESIKNDDSRIACSVTIK